MRLAVVTLMGAVACSSETTGATPAGCADPTGNYKVSTTKVSGTCDTGDTGESTVTISRVNGELSVAIPGIEGGCPAELDASSCKLTALCKIFDLKTKDTLATFNIDYTIAGNKLSGTMAAGLKPPIKPTACDVTERHEGTKL